MKINELKLMYTTHIPERDRMETGVLYISEKYETAIHLCACGCGEQVVTPLDDGTKHWQKTGTRDSVTLRPSIGNPWCKAHYYVTENKIDWLP